MSLSSLLNTPENEQEWDSWTFSLRNQNAKTRQAIQQQSNGAFNLFEYQLDPINFDEINDWLARVQQSLDDINSSLNLQGSDLESTDITDPKQLQSFVYGVYQQYNSAALALGI